MSAYGANQHTLAQQDCMSNAFSTNEFLSKDLGMEYDKFQSISGQLSVSPSSRKEIDTSFGIFDNIKFDSNFSNPLLHQSMYSNGCGYTGANNGAMDPSFTLNSFNNRNGGPYQLPQASFPYNHQRIDANKMTQFAPIDYESLQLKISQKKQSLDILQGVLPDPLEPGQEKKYITNTERIQVPSSDHVAEIVGKNGQRIKQLREQLKVWVKTPSRDEPPIFEVTGLPEKLAEAKKTILMMSEHFTRVQMDRQRQGSTSANMVDDRLYVEQDKVGLIVGANGQTIRWVQQLSDTHIATPRKQESIPGLPPPQTFFTISGLPDKVRFAKQLICEYVTLRCQGLWLDPDLDPSAEASRLVREFHQRRQLEDGQKNPPAGNAATAGHLRPINNGNSCSPIPERSYYPPADVAPRLDSTAAAAAYRDSQHPGSMHQLVSQMEELWMRPEGNLGGGGSGSGGFWNQMLFGGCNGSGDMRGGYLAADPHQNGGHQAVGHDPASAAATFQAPLVPLEFPEASGGGGGDEQASPPAPLPQQHLCWM